jgi:hypothetical protein
MLRITTLIAILSAPPLAAQQPSTRMTPTPAASSPPLGHAPTSR